MQGQGCMGNSGNCQTRRPQTGGGDLRWRAFKGGPKNRFKKNALSHEVGKEGSLRAFKTKRSEREKGKKCRSNGGGGWGGAGWPSFLRGRDSVE